MKKTKLEKGITLIALIITIVVLMILAVVTIGAIRDNSIIEHAQIATEKYVVGDEKERIQLAYSDYKISKYEPIGRTADQDELETFFLGENKQGVSALDLINTEKSTEDTYIVDYKDEEIEIKLSEATFNNDTNEIYLYISYNGNRYKLTVENTNTAMTKKLEAIKAEPQLKVEGADVTGDEETAWTIKFSDTGNIYILTNDGKITQVTEQNLLLKQYILGADLAGRPLTDIMNVEAFSFIDDVETEGIDETHTVGAKYKGSLVESENLFVMYFESQGVTYKFGFSKSSPYITDKDYGIVKVYEQEEGTRVGKTVKYDDKIWTILYDDSTNGLQMISNETLLYNEAEFYIGCKDSSITDWDSLISIVDLDNDGELNNFEKAVYSYNNAIDTLNIACDSVVTDNDNIIDVRCVGSNPTDKSYENEILYTSENLAKWPGYYDTNVPGIVNGKAKSTDSNYILDYEKMVGLGIHIGYDSAGKGSEYWLASRCIEDTDCIYFRVRKVDEKGASQERGIFYVNSSSIYGYDYSDAKIPSLRPVVSLNPSIQLQECTTGEADYTF